MVLMGFLWHTDWSPFKTMIRFVIGTLIFLGINFYLFSLLGDGLGKEPTFYGNSVCKPTGQLAISALSRVKSSQCRDQILEAVCAIEQQAEPEIFPDSGCPSFNKSLIGHYEGCFYDEINNRTLNGYMYELVNDNSPITCRAHCYRAGFVYFGLEYGKECFCGDSIRSSKVLSRDFCQKYRCSGNSEFCGGINAIAIYKTGLNDGNKITKAKYVEVDPNREVTIKILFVLQFNGRNDRQVKRLLKTIYSPKHMYYIHVDQRQTYMVTEMRKVAAHLPNIYVVPNGRATIWGGASLLTMMLDIIQDSIQRAEFSQWDYLLNLSESDFPVLSLKELEHQLQMNNGKSYLASHGYNTAEFIRKQGFDYVFSECEQRMWRIAKRDKFPRNLRLDGGSDWIVLHRAFAEYALTQEELPRRLRQLFKSIILPLESFFHTLALNSKFCKSVLSSNLKLTNWNRKQGCRCASLKKVVDWCGCSPLIFKKEHLQKFAVKQAKSKAQYFARKFESLVDIDAVAAAEAQSLRDRAHLINSSHPSFSSTFVNFYKDDIDGYSVANFLLAKSLWDMSSYNTMKFTALERIDTYRAKANADSQMIFSIRLDGARDPAQLLVERKEHTQLSDDSIVNGFKLEKLSFGINLDHKEEIFRNPTAFVDSKGVATIALTWIRLNQYETTVNSTKTSPDIKLLWKNPDKNLVATQALSPYDSINGVQFASLDFSTLQSNVKSGIWTVHVRDGSRVVGTVFLPVFTLFNDTLSRSLVSQFYSIADSCSDCATVPWSLTYPDPKSDIRYGYDPVLMWLS